MLRTSFRQGPGVAGALFSCCLDIRWEDSKINIKSPFPGQNKKMEEIKRNNKKIRENKTCFLFNKVANAGI